jgi:hypothetical protein
MFVFPAPVGAATRRLPELWNADLKTLLWILFRCFVVRKAPWAQAGRDEIGTRFFKEISALGGGAIETIAQSSVSSFLISFLPSVF